MLNAVCGDIYLFDLHLYNWSKERTLKLEGKQGILKQRGEMAFQRHQQQTMSDEIKRTLRDEIYRGFTIKGPDHS